MPFTALVKVRNRAQITLPADARRALEVSEGDYLDAEVVEGGVILKPSLQAAPGSLRASARGSNMSRHASSGDGPMGRRVRQVVGGGALIALALGAQGCREEEQDRVLVHEPGVYQGQADQALDEATVEELRRRARAQKF